MESALQIYKNRFHFDGWVFCTTTIGTIKRQLRKEFILYNDESQALHKVIGFMKKQKDIPEFVHRQGDEFLSLMIEIVNEKQLEKGEN